MILLTLISLYQRTISPDHGPLKMLFPQGACRFEPTCSEYTRQAVKQRGWYGLWSGAGRVLRCHPFTRGGYDPL